MEEKMLKIILDFPEVFPGSDTVVDLDDNTYIFKIDK
jgi:hypothetical protein